MAVCEGPLGQEQADEEKHGEDIARHVCLLDTQVEVAAPLRPRHAGAYERREYPQWRFLQDVA
eukprot:2683498-Prorocentrum_lima.AAC.1